MLLLGLAVGLGCGSSVPSEANCPPAPAWIQPMQGYMSNAMLRRMRDDAMIDAMTLEQGSFDQIAAEDEVVRYHYFIKAYPDGICTREFFDAH